MSKTTTASATVKKTIATASATASKKTATASASKKTASKKTTDSKKTASASKKTTATDSKKTDSKKTDNNSFLDVTTLLESIKFDANKYEILRCYDCEEFSATAVYRKSYALIRNKTDKRAVIKLWGHRDFVACECSKMLRKRIDVSSALYTSKSLDKNNNYICKSLKDATALCNDFIKQVDAQKDATATASKKTDSATA